METFDRPLFPEAFLRECETVLGAEFPAFLRALSSPASRALRLNPLRAPAPGEAAPFLESGAPEVPWEPLGRYVAPGQRPGAGLAHACGAFYLQDASAMASAAALAPTPGERVLDLCAAPGGKSGQIAARLMGKGFLWANEIDFSRARALNANLERLGIAGACVSCASPEALSARLPGFFDAILVDAPCSGEGMFRRDAASVAEWSEDAPARCAARQAGILDRAAEMLRPGGRLAYSTCTFNRAENEDTVAAFLLRHPEFFPSEFALPGVGASNGGCIRLWPHKIRGEGHFVALMKKAGSPTRETLSPPAESRAAREAGARLAESAASRLPEGILTLEGDALYLSPPLAPPAARMSGAGVRILRAGLPLARIQKDRLEPEHALAMALSPRDARRAASLTGEQAARFMAGEALPLDAEKGWTLAAWRGMPLGWGKVSDGALKNHLPKGLRLRGGHALDAAEEA